MTSEILHLLPLQHDASDVLNDSLVDSGTGTVASALNTLRLAILTRTLQDCYNVDASASPDITYESTFDFEISGTDLSEGSNASGIILTGSSNSGASGIGGPLLFSGGTGLGNAAVGGLVQIFSGDGSGKDTLSGDAYFGSGAANEAANSISGNVYIGSGGSTANSGNLVLYTGDPSDSGNSGFITMLTGDCVGSGNTGEILISSGDGVDATGPVTVKTGSSEDVGGTLSLLTGNCTGDSGSIIIQTGTGASRGAIQINAPTIAVTAENYTISESFLGTVAFTVANTNNTSSANASIEARSTGTSGGDAYFKMTISAGASWAMGADNSATDNWVLSQSATLGTNNALTFAVTTLAATFGGSITTTRSTTATVSVTINNTNNAAGTAMALNQISVGGTSAGDPLTTYTIPSGTSWSTGIDNSASDAFVICNSTALGTTNAISISTSLQALFSADIDVTNLCRAESLRADGDVAGVASTTTFTNGTDTNSGVAGTILRRTSGTSAGNNSWIKIYVGTTAYYIPVWD